MAQRTQSALGVVADAQGWRPVTRDTPTVAVSGGWPFPRAGTSSLGEGRPKPRLPASAARGSFIPVSSRPQQHGHDGAERWHAAPPASRSIASLVELATGPGSASPWCSSLSPTVALAPAPRPRPPPPTGRCRPRPSNSAAGGHHHPAAPSTAIPCPSSSRDLLQEGGQGIESAAGRAEHGSVLQEVGVVLVTVELVALLG
jgi:hypothetical protein